MLPAMISRAVRSLALGCLVVLATAACDTTEPEPIYELSAHYRLQSMDGHELPHEWSCYSGNPEFKCTMSAAHISVLSDELLEYSWTMSSGFAEPRTVVTGYSYTRIGNRLLLTSLPYAQVTESFELRIGQGSIWHGKNLFVAAPPE